MTDATFMKNVTRPRDDVMRSHPRRFIDYQDAVHGLLILDQ